MSGISLGCLVDARGHWKTDRLVKADRKATVGLKKKKTVIKNDVCRRASDSSRRSHRVILLTAENRNLRLIKIGHKIGKTLPGPTSLDFYCNIRMVGSQFGANK